MGYIDFLEKNHYPIELVRIAKGLVDVPLFTVQAPADMSFGFPPVLIPLWSNASWPGYIGIEKHWFGDRPGSFVQFYAEDYSFVEIARSVDQLKAWMVFDFLCNVPASDEVGNFAESIGFCAADSVDEIFAGCESVSDLAMLEIFKNNLPSAVSGSDQFCGPNWVVEKSDSAEISHLISSGLYEDAWYRLNSVAVDREEILNVLNMLSAHVPDKHGFMQMMDCWVASNL